MRNRSLVLAGTVIAGAALMLAPASVAGATKVKPVDSNLAQYLANTPLSTEQGTFSVPSYTCKKADNVAVQLSAYNPGLAQFDSANVFLACSTKGSVPTVGVGLDLNGTYSYPSLAISEGDTVTLSLACGSGGTTVSVDDVTTGDSTPVSSATATSCQGSGVGLIGVSSKKPGKLSKLPTFGSVTFSSASVNGSPLQDASPTGNNYYEGKKAQMMLGPIGASGGFTVTDG